MKIFPLLTNRNQRIYEGKLWMQNSFQEKNQFIAKYIRKPKISFSQKIPSDENPRPPRKFEIREGETPQMVSESGQVICIKQTKDSRVFGFFGERGTGKSVSMEGFLNREWAYNNSFWVDMNDYQNQTTYSLEPQAYPPFIKRLWLMGEEPMGVPSFHIYPLSKKKVTKTHDFVSLETAIPFKEVIENATKYTDWSQSRKYLDVIVPKLERAKSIEEGYSIIDENVKNSDSREFIKGYIGSLYNSGVISFDSSKVSILKVKSDYYDEKFSPVLALLRLRCIPRIMTNRVIGKPYYPSFMSYHLGELFSAQTDESSYFGRNKVLLHLSVDEILNLEEAGGKKDNVAIKKVEEIVLRGRPARINFYYASQSPIKSERMSKPLMTNTNYFFCTRMTSEEAIKIASIFGKKRYAKIISRLRPKMYEGVLMSKEDLICYDLESNERTIINEPVKGYYLPPLCNSPMSSGG